MKFMSAIALPNEEVIILISHGIGTPRRSLESGKDEYRIDCDSFLDILDEVDAQVDVRLTFDDGNAADVHVACRHSPSEVWRPAASSRPGGLGKPGSVDSDGVRALLARHMPIGTHGMSHRPWRGPTDSDRRVELVDARQAIAEACGATINAGALPFGQYDHRGLAESRQLECRAVYSSDVCRDEWGVVPASVHRPCRGHA